MHSDRVPTIMLQNFDSLNKINNNSNAIGTFNTTQQLILNYSSHLNYLIHNHNNNNNNSNVNSEINLTTTTIDNIHKKNANFTIYDFDEQKEFIFDRTDVRIIFITLYTLVFCCCFFGNLLVILVVTLSRRLRSITNFFLANLAVADFCVGVFCVMQNLSIYLITSWVFGDFLCKMYQFIHSLSYTASIFILVVICMERYFAIIHPIQCKQILTPTRLRLVIVGVWITSAIYSIPKFIFVRTITNTFGDGVTETICIPHRKLYDSELFDFINFILLYVTPLLVMMILYSRIAIALWKSSRGLERHVVNNTNSNSTTSSYNNNHLLNHHRQNSRYEKRPVQTTDSQVSIDSDKGAVITTTTTTTYRTHSFHKRHGTHLTQLSHSSSNVLRARRGVIRMLMVVVLTFALCNLPFHARKMWQYWSNDYQGDSNFNALFTPLTFLVTYFNSGVNPLLYAFLSRNFRKGMRELLLCSLKKNKNKLHHPKVPLQASTRQSTKCTLYVEEDANSKSVSRRSVESTAC